VILIVAGQVCNIWLPINKNLWTDSYTLFMGGLSFVMFAGFLWLVDGRGWQRGVKPFVIFGANAIVMYMTSEFGSQALSAIRWTDGAHRVTLKGWLYRNVFAGLASPYNASLMYAIAYVLVIYLLAWFMYRRRWFVRI
jgi:predicted acyltransferase